VEAAGGSFENVRSSIDRSTQERLGKRQIEEMVGRAAIDFDAFYAERPVARNKWLVANMLTAGAFRRQYMGGARSWLRLALRVLIVSALLVVVLLGTRDLARSLLPSGRAVGASNASGAGAFPQTSAAAFATRFALVHELRQQSARRAPACVDALPCQRRRPVRRMGRAGQANR
jgi:hypothetical protein